MPTPHTILSRSQSENHYEIIEKLWVETLNLVKTQPLKFLLIHTRIWNIKNRNYFHCQRPIFFDNHPIKGIGVEEDSVVAIHCCVQSPEIDDDKVNSASKKCPKWLLVSLSTGGGRRHHYNAPVSLAIGIYTSTSLAGAVKKVNTNMVC